LRRYLVDTSAVSELEPSRRPQVDQQVSAWFVRNAPYLYISTISVMEIESGSQKLSHKGATRRRSDLSAWLATLMADFRQRLIAIDYDVAIAAGRLDALALAKGRHPGLADILIAASAQVHGLMVLTRNLRHFRPLGVPAANPFRELP
jgi:predicted nucleic acid-binding protein